MFIPKMKKIIYYNDWLLLLEIFLIYIKISIFCLVNKSHLLLAMVQQNPARLKKNQNRNKIIRYVNLCSFLRKKIGLKETCFTYAVTLCYILRKYGINAQINFGAKKREIPNYEDSALIGHCWVSVDKGKIEIPYEFIFGYPEL